MHRLRAGTGEENGSRGQGGRLARKGLDILDAIAAGRQPPELTAHRLIRTVHLPIVWAAQKQLLGIP